MGLGWSEVLVLGVLAVVVFGPDLPRVARDAGRVMYELQRMLRETLRF
ncbi:MAG: twin-arginine translocase TatA/TatE family subunit [Deltaproteobacteria bacterium]|nr:twin-arginine translocase TatA/TatE family subunit [Deltaproteobacteria bacterium]